ncbi:Hypothetical protein, putative [Bodo saltans]|uniref:Uncharacterized protein n=1 Tax=Bodo saltans TaxID=75058 RepID=A0A0S4J736_BODSA|nr:Hypothetical protein, putative [Bodo saltans]|eukprot:CUG85580.1 Hypothetical protein, putative [Bodo saltans]
MIHLVLVSTGQHSDMVDDDDKSAAELLAFDSNERCDDKPTTTATAVEVMLQPSSTHIAEAAAERIRRQQRSPALFSNIGVSTMLLQDHDELSAFSDDSDGQEELAGAAHAPNDSFKHRGPDFLHQGDDFRFPKSSEGSNDNEAQNEKQSYRHRRFTVHGDVVHQEMLAKATAASEQHQRAKFSGDDDDDDYDFL